MFTKLADILLNHSCLSLEYSSGHWEQKPMAWGNLGFTRGNACPLPQIWSTWCPLENPSGPQLTQNGKQSPLRKSPRPNTRLCNAMTRTSILPSQTMYLATDISWEISGPNFTALYSPLNLLHLHQCGSS